ncbi:DUF2461 domain-containing protein [Oscillospiraceae bacterium OttesenSCG-928-F05]|nr:DUF2461 domain-containing protein [Oscillospiraceae bacterium OttesenSCG-928-F05]
MFTPETFQFLVENRLNDSLDWFHAHKQDYQRLVVAPFAELVEALTPTMLDIDPFFVTEPKITRTISRIYRDTRFSKDKSRYRDSTWLYFRRERKLFPGYPSFYFEITPLFIRWGCGFYMADSATMASYRKLILQRDPLFKKALKAYEKQSVFSIDQESRYKRSKFPDEPENVKDFLDRKSVYLGYETRSHDILYSEALPTVLAENFASIAPVYHLFLGACDRKITPERVRERG